LIPAFAWETDRLPVGCALYAGAAGVERRLGLLMRRFGAVDGGIDDDVTDVEITTWKVSCNPLNFRKQFAEGFFRAVFISP
jgi:hypothetical protein